MLYYLCKRLRKLFYWRFSMPTLADVATLAGCSVSVASRVLKNKDNSEDRIADATRDRVRKAAEK